MEPRGLEGIHIPARNKSGLETPLCGRLVGEKKLVFAPPSWYDTLVVCCLVFGVGQPLLTWLGILNGVLSTIWLGPAVLLAGIWAVISQERMTIDIRSKTYMRLEGSGMLKRVSRGPISDLDALVLISQQHVLQGKLVMPGQTGVTYRLVLHWKGRKMPPLIVEQETSAVALGGPLNANAGRIFQTGSVYAKVMEVRYFDNSYYHQNSPLQPL